MNVKELVTLAINAASNSYSPYSGFKVGAALLSKDGRIFLGCNIENASYSPTVCAERVAFFKAISEGVRDFSMIAIVGGESVENDIGSRLCPPCGVCRQVMAEFCDVDSFKVILTDGDDIKEYLLKELLPLNFKG